MSKVSRPPVVTDQTQQLVNDQLLDGINMIARFVDFGTGVPAHTPTGPSVIYFRLDGVAGAAVYAWNGTSWTALV